MALKKIKNIYNELIFYLIKFCFIFLSFILENYLSYFYQEFNHTVTNTWLKLRDEYPNHYFHFYNDWYITQTDLCVLLTIDNRPEFYSILYSQGLDSRPAFWFAFLIDYNRFRKL